MWPHTDVAKECAVLAKMGYLGVKLFPAQEQLMSFETFSGDLNPWYFAYQPVSYRLQGRMGTRDQLRYNGLSFTLADGSPSLPG
jgi:alpha-amylase